MKHLFYAVCSMALLSACATESDGPTLLTISHQKERSIRYLLVNDKHAIELLNARTNVNHEGMTQREFETWLSRHRRARIPWRNDPGPNFKPNGDSLDYPDTRECRRITRLGAKYGVEIYLLESIYD